MRVARRHDARRPHRERRGAGRAARRGRRARALPRAADDVLAAAAHESDAREPRPRASAARALRGLRDDAARRGCSALLVGGAYLDLVLAARRPAKGFWFALAAAEVGQAWLGARWAAGTRRARHQRPARAHGPLVLDRHELTVGALSSSASAPMAAHGSTSSSRSWRPLAAPGSLFLVATVFARRASRPAPVPAPDAPSTRGGWRERLHHEDELSRARVASPGIRRCSAAPSPDSSSASRSTLASGRAPLWIPLACSVVLEALVGARHGEARVAAARRPEERARVARRTRSLLAAVSAPALIWIAASHAAAVNAGIGFLTLRRRARLVGALRRALPSATRRSRWRPR